METTWLATDNLELTFNATWNDGDIDEFDDTQLFYVEDASIPAASNCSRIDLSLVQVDSCSKNRSNENLPRLPDATYFAAAQYIIETSVGVFVPHIQIETFARNSKKPC